MALFALTREYFENLTLTTHPRREFYSASIASSQETGMFGTVNVFAQKSGIEKEAQKLRAFSDGSDEFSDETLEAYRQGLVLSASDETLTNFTSSMAEFLGKINDAGVSERKKKFVEVIRFEPSFRFTADTQRKNVVRDILFPYYRDRYPSMHWACTNYHTLNFYTASNVPSDSVLIYPAKTDESKQPSQVCYSPSGSFTFEFYVNPRYTSDQRDGHFKAGTIFHMSSSFAISLVTGSNVAIDGRPNGYRLLLQLSSSAEVPPSLIPLNQENNQRSIDDMFQGCQVFNPATNQGTATDMIFLSSDNSLKRNNWHHVAIRWGTNTINHGTGSFMIDGIEDATFVIPSGTVIPQEFDKHFGQDERLGDPGALFVGNFYEGQNNIFDTDADLDTIPDNDTHYIAGFFDEDTCAKEGLRYGDAASSYLDPLEPGSYRFDHPLNAEIHELKIWDEYRTDDELLMTSAEGISNLDEEPALMFYVPPFFVKETRVREVLLTPFQDMFTTTDDPFNVALSFGVGGHLLNLENYCREFVRGDYPRLLNLTASRIDTQAQEAREANEYLFTTGSIRKRNLTVLPCDNGKFFPGFQLLMSGARDVHPVSGSLLEKYTNDFGSLDFSKISLDNLIPEETLFPGLIQTSMDGTDDVSTGSIMFDIAGASPENPGVAPGSVLTIFQRTRDGSSNEVVFFDASNLFYGNRIEPGTFELVDNDVTCSDGKIKITLRDNGIGGLYRADAETPHPAWSDVGSIMYEEGVAVVKSPVIPYFGKEQFNVTFQGEQNLHIMEIHVPCGAGTINSSSNPQYQPLFASNFASETDSEFVYITGLNFHDENLNVVARTNLATPVMKRESDGYVFRVKVDF